MCVAMLILALVGFLLMLFNYIERPDNNSGISSQYFLGRREWHPKWPEQNEIYSHKYLRWWER
jgi:hypothetical protein